MNAKQLEVKYCRILKCIMRIYIWKILSGIEIMTDLDQHRIYIIQSTLVYYMLCSAVSWQFTFENKKIYDLSIDIF